MFPSRYFNPRFWTARFWAKTGEQTPDCFEGFEGKIQYAAAYEGAIDLNEAVIGFINDDPIAVTGILYQAARYEGFINSSDTLSEYCTQDKKDYIGVAVLATILIDFGLVTSTITEFIDYGDLTGDCIQIDSIGFFLQSNIQDKAAFIGHICD